MSSSPKTSLNSLSTGLSSTALLHHQPSPDHANQDGSAGGQSSNVASGHDHRGQPASGDTNGSSSLTLRALVSTKEAGVIIGKGGANVAELREKSGVKAGVSKVIPGVHDRVLTITGSLEGVAKAFSLIASTILDNPVSVLNGGVAAAAPSNSPNSQGGSGGIATIRLLISHNLMGSVIGRQGLKIKQIQDTSGVRMVASKDMLPSSTERSIELQGSVQGIETAVAEVGKCLIGDWERGQNTVPYQPGMDTLGIAGGVLGVGAGDGSLLSGSLRQPSLNMPAMAGLTSSRPRGAPFAPHGVSSTGGTSVAAAVSAGGVVVAPTANGATIPSQVVDGDLRVQNISIPSDMVGCIIGKGGSKITEIRRISGSRISIAKVPHDESGERMFTIQGSAESNEKALFLLYNSLEGEKERRASAAASQIPSGGDKGTEV